jgi:hypothetical protein
MIYSVLRAHSITLSEFFELHQIEQRFLIRAVQERDEREEKEQKREQSKHG